MRFKSHNESDFLEALGNVNTKNTYCGIAFRKPFGQLGGNMWCFILRNVII